jgi:predicted transcriptional regulator
MNIKDSRLTKIKNFLRYQSSPSTVTEIHEALNKRLNLDISRKTVERHIIELTEQGVVACQRGVPSKYFLTKPSEVEVVLQISEINVILEKLDITSDLYHKLRRLL